MSLAPPQYCPPGSSVFASLGLMKKARQTCRCSIGGGGEPISSGPTVWDLRLESGLCKDLSTGYSQRYMGYVSCRDVRGTRRAENEGNKKCSMTWIL